MGTNHCLSRAVEAVSCCFTYLRWGTAWIHLWAYKFLVDKKYFYAHISHISLGITLACALNDIPFSLNYEVRNYPNIVLKLFLTSWAVFFCTVDLFLGRIVSIDVLFVVLRNVHVVHQPYWQHYYWLFSWNIWIWLFRV